VTCSKRRERRVDKFFGFFDEKPIDPTSFKAIRIALT
jgi:hypothetical protein